MELNETPFPSNDEILWPARVFQSAWLLSFAVFLLACFIEVRLLKKKSASIVVLISISFVILRMYHSLQWLFSMLYVILANHSTATQSMQREFK